MLCTLALFLLLSWHHHQAEDFFFFSGRRGRIGAWGGGIARTVMSQIALSLGKLIHQSVTSDSAEGHYRKRQRALV